MVNDSTNVWRYCVGSFIKSDSNVCLKMLLLCIEVYVLIRDEIIKQSVMALWYMMLLTVISHYWIWLQSNKFILCTFFRQLIF